MNILRTLFGMSNNLITAEIVKVLKGKVKSSDDDNSYNICTLVVKSNFNKNKLSNFLKQTNSEFSVGFDYKETLKTCGFIIHNQANDLKLVISFDKEDPNAFIALIGIFKTKCISIENYSDTSESKKFQLDLSNQLQIYSELWNDKVKPIYLKESLKANMRYLEQYKNWDDQKIDSYINSNPESLMKFEKYTIEDWES